MRSPALQRAYDLAGYYAGRGWSVLLQGPSGAGKERLAEHFAATSGRKKLEVLNCSAIPADLIESELFGVERGAATGVAERKGAFERAHGGVLFLDELGELPLHLQPKLLRALEGDVRRVGGDRRLNLDVLVVAATHRDLEAMVDAGDFRLDLWQRFDGVVQVPGLEQRPEDVRRIIAEVHAEIDGAPRLTAAAVEALAGGDWSRGQVRALRRAVRAAVAAAELEEAVAVAARHVVARARRQLDTAVLSTPEAARRAGSTAVDSAGQCRYLVRAGWTRVDGWVPPG